MKEFLGLILFNFVKGPLIDSVPCLYVSALFSRHPTILSVALLRLRFVF